MEITDAIKNRHSVRRYTDKPLPAEAIEKINTKLLQLNGRYNIRIVLVTDEPRAFGSFFATYGQFKGVRNYLVLIADKNEANAEEHLGYAGEQVVLAAREMGIDSCWVGLTYSKSKIPVDIAPYEKIFAVIALGYGVDHGHSHKIKSPQQVAPGYDEAPAWFKQGVDMALLAPTALNQQKFKFELDSNGNVVASTARGPYTQMDLGIARCHFDIGAGRLQ